MRTLQTKRLVVSVLLFVAATTGIATTEPLLRRHAVEVESEVVAPPSIAEYLTFGYGRGVAAVLWLKTLSWYGGKMLEGSLSLETPEEVEYLDSQSRLMIRLDPDFPDPYSFAYMLLQWYAGKPGLALPYAVAGMQQFPDDWNYPFYYAFTHYWFIKDYQVASRFFSIAGTKPNVPAFVPLLGARLVRQEQDTKEAIRTLKGLLETSKMPEGIAKPIRDEVHTLEAIAVVEEAVLTYTAKFGAEPTSRDLLASGVLSEMPLDHAGKPIIIQDDGTVTAVSGGLH